jgi:glycosyltransferase involved in cell wall biosynthesis
MLIERPKLSVCLPVFNGQQYLAAAIESILGQTFSDFELIIVDNASTDETESIARRFAEQDKRISFFGNPKNLGAAPNFNRAFEVSRGPLIRWASADDYWAPDAMKLCVTAMEDRSIVCCHGKTVVVDGEGLPIPTYERGRGGSGVAFDRLYDPPDRKLDAPRAADRFRELLLRTHWCYEIFGVMRRDVLLRTELHGSFYGSDKVLLAELSMAGRIVTLPETVFYRRDHLGNSTSLRTHTDRADWMDTSLQGRIRRPHFQLLAGYSRAIRRGPIGLGEKLACTRVLLSWMLQVRKLKNVVYESDSQSQTTETVSAHS